MRNKNEQVAYLLKQRNGGMSNADFKAELEKLYQLGYWDGRDEADGYCLTHSIRD